MNVMAAKVEFRGEIDTVVETGEKAFFSVRDIHAWYGESYIVQGVSFDVKKGEVLSLLGRNGAGKTSTLRTLARASNPVLKSGEIWLDGQPVHKMKAFQAAQAGIQLVPEDRRIIGGLTVEENLVLAQVSGQKGWTIEKIYDHFPRLAERRNQEAVTMSGGEQQMLAVGRALMAGPKLLMLDEPSLGLAPKVAAGILDTLGELNRNGLGILLVEQKAPLALKLARRVYVLSSGSVRAELPAQEIKSHHDLAKFYFH